MDRFAAAQNVPPNEIPATPSETPLGQLLAVMGVRREQPESRAVERPLGASEELKVIREFRDTWSQLSVDNQVKQAIAQAPENAGPLNSHMLVLRSLTQMRELSPDYLNRFMIYIDTLMCLEQADKKVRPQNANGRATSSASSKASKARKTK
jgi:hypothetical protein